MRANILVLVVIVIIILLGVKRGSADSYEFVVYPLFQEASIASLGIDFGEPRLNHDSTKYLTNKNSNIPLTPDELERVKRLLDDHSETLYGNGHPGLKVEVDRLNQIAKQDEASRKWRSALWAGAVLAGLGGLINLAVAFWKL
jgi:hypothetical protein